MLLLYRHRKGASPLFAGVLAIQWAWAGAVYHLVYFRPINPAAVAFGLLFLAQAALLLWRGVRGRRLTFTPSGSRWSWVGGGLMIYALVYPFIGVLTGLQYPLLPTFGVPCPTTILTAGALLTLPRRAARPLAIVPVTWSAIGGSAAILLRVRADSMLPVAGVTVLLYVLTTGRDLPPSPD